MPITGREDGIATRRYTQARLRDRRAQLDTLAADWSEAEAAFRAAARPVPAPTPGPAAWPLSSSPRNHTLSAMLYDEVFRTDPWQGVLGEAEPMPAPTPDPDNAPGAYYNSHRVILREPSADGRRAAGWQQGAFLVIPPLPRRLLYRVAVIGLTKLPPRGKAIVSQVLHQLRLHYTPLHLRTGPCQGVDAVVYEYATGYQVPVRRFPSTGENYVAAEDQRYTASTHAMLNRVQLVIGITSSSSHFPSPPGYLTLRRLARRENIPFQEYVLPCEDSTTIDPE